MAPQDAVPDKVRSQRDRFIAFAFAAADVLVELTKDGEIAYCAGTTDKLLGVTAGEVTGKRLDSIIIKTDRPALSALLQRLGRQGRVEGVPVRLSVPGKNQVTARISGLCLPDRPECYYLALSHHVPSPPNTGKSDGKNAGDTETAAEKARSPQQEFARMVEERMRRGEEIGEDVQLTLIDLPDELLKKRLAPELAEDFMSGVESYLRAWSMDGNSVGRLADGKLGVVHGESLPTESIEEQIGAMAREADPDGEPVTVKAATIDLEHDNLTQEDVEKALVYTINKFVEEGGESFAVKSLSGGYQEELDKTLARVTKFRKTINSERLVLVFQPIIHLNDWTVHHYESLTRVREGERLFLPAQFIDFAEGFGMVEELDLVVCKRAIEVLKSNKGIGKKDEIAVNLSGRSICSEGFIAELIWMLTENKALLPRLIFEVTESAEIKDLEQANKVIQRIRGFGCEVCIDDFGAGAAAFQYLRALQVDVVKIDGVYIRDAFDDKLGKPFLKAISGLCHDLKIQTIGEMIEDMKTVELLREVGIDYGQGYFFSKPIEDVSAFTVPPKR